LIDLIDYTKQGMAAMAFNRSQRCWGRRPHFLFGGLFTTAEIDSLGSPVINVARLPHFGTSSTSQWFQVPPISMATGWKTFVLASSIVLGFVRRCACLVIIYISVELAVLETRPSSVSMWHDREFCLCGAGHH